MPVRRPRLSRHDSGAAFCAAALRRKTKMLCTSAGRTSPADRRSCCLCRVALGCFLFLRPLLLGLATSDTLTGLGCGGCRGALLRGCGLVVGWKGGGDAAVAPGRSSHVCCEGVLRAHDLYRRLTAFLIDDGPEPPGFGMVGLMRLSWMAA